MSNLLKCLYLQNFKKLNSVREKRFVFDPPVTKAEAKPAAEKPEETGKTAPAADTKPDDAKPPKAQLKEFKDKWKGEADKDGHTPDFKSKIGQITKSADDKFNELKDKKSKDVPEGKVGDFKTALDKLSDDAEKAAEEEKNRNDVLSAITKVIDPIKGAEDGMSKRISDAKDALGKIDCKGLDNDRAVLQLKDTQTRFLDSAAKLVGKFDGIKCEGDKCKAAKTAAEKESAALVKKMAAGNANESEVIATARNQEMQIVGGYLKDYFKGKDDKESLDAIAKLLTTYESGDATKLKPADQTAIAKLVAKIQDDPKLRDLVQIKLEGGADAEAYSTGHAYKGYFDSMCKAAKDMAADAKINGDHNFTANAALINEMANIADGKNPDGTAAAAGDTPAKIWTKFVNSHASDDIGNPAGPLNTVLAYQRLQNAGEKITGDVTKSIYLETSKEGGKYRYSFVLGMKEGAADDTRTPAGDTPAGATTGTPGTGPATGPAGAPGTAPSGRPGTAPATGPTGGPTTGPTAGPTTGPTVGPTTAPTTGPTTIPTSAPSTVPGHDIANMEKDKVYVDSTNKQFKFDGTSYLYNNGSGFQKVKVGDPKETLNVLTGRQKITENYVQGISQNELPGINVSTNKLEIKGYNEAAKIVDVTITNSAGTDSVGFTLNLLTGVLTPDPTSKKVFKLLDPTARANDLAVLKSKGFDIGTVSPSIGEPQKSITEWINLNTTASILLALKGDGGTKPGLLLNGELNPAITGATMEQVIACFKAQPTLLDKGQVDLKTDTLKLILPKVDIDANFSGIATYFADKKTAITTLLDGNFDVKFSTLKTDIDANKADADVMKSVLNRASEKSFQAEFAAELSTNQSLRIETVKYLLKGGGDLPTYLIEKMTSLADYIALDGPGGTNLTKAQIQTKLGDLITRAIDDKSQLPSQADFSKLAADVWKDPATGYWAANAPSKVYATYDSLAAGKKNILASWKTGYITNKPEYLTTMLNRVEVKDIDVAAIKADPASQKEIITALDAMKATSPKAMELSLLLEGQQAAPSATPTPAETADKQKVLADFTAAYTEMKSSVSALNAERILGIAKSLEAAPATLITAADKQEIDRGSGTSAPSEANFTKTLKTQKALAQYELSKTGKALIRDINLTGTTIDAKDPIALYINEFKAVNLVTPVKPTKEFLDAIKAGKYATPQLEALLIEAGNLWRADKNAYIELAVATGLSGRAKAQIEADFATKEHLKDMWLSKLEASGSTQQKDLLTKAYLAIPATANTATDAEALQVIEACLAAGIESVEGKLDPTSGKVVQDGSTLRIDDQVNGHLNRIAGQLSAATAGTPGHDNALKATELLFQFESGSCQAGTATCNKGELVKELGNAYLRTPATLTNPSALAPEKYDMMKKVVFGDACKVEEGDLTGPTTKNGITITEQDKHETYATLLYALAVRTPATAENAGYEAKFKTLDAAWIPASGPVHDKYINLTSTSTLSTPPGATNSATDVAAQASYVEAAISSPSPTPAQLKEAAKWAKIDATKTPPNRLEAVVAKVTDVNAKAELYMIAFDNIASNGLDYNKTLEKATDLANGTPLLNPTTFENLATKVKTQPTSHPYLVELIATKYPTLNNANLALSIMDSDKVPVSSKTNLEKIWRGFKTSSAVGPKLKDIAVKLVDGPSAARDAALKALDYTSPVAPSAPGVIPVAPAVPASGTRQEIYDAYAPTTSEAARVKAILNIL